MEKIIRMESEEHWGRPVYFCTDDGCGTIKCIYDLKWPDTCELSDLIVHPDKRNQGYATALMQAAEKDARSEGCMYLRLWVSDTATWKIQWYERLGFRELIPNHKPKYPIIWMEKELKY